MRQELQEIKVLIYEDGQISDSELKMLSGLFAHSFEEDEATLLLDLNNVLSETGVPEPFVQMFVTWLAGYVVVDGALDDGRWDWMRRTMLNDSTIDETEKRLLREIRSRIQSVPDSLAVFVD